MAISNLTIDITDAPLGIEQRAELEFMPELDFSLDFEITGVSASIIYTVNSDEIALSVDAEATLVGECARCLSDAEVQQHAEFSEIIPIYREASKPDSDVEYYSDGNTLVLDKLLIDALLLSAPTRFLCSDECKGLCPRCGANLNITTCDCQNEPDEFNPFSSLKGLFKD